MALHRTFSFEDGDERALSSNEQERLDYTLSHSPYRDSPSRPSTISPPPQYTSPPPDEPVSPVTPTRSRNSNRSGWSQADRQRDTHDSSQPILDSFHDSPGRDSSPPPVPPPHRELLANRSSGDERQWRNSMGYSQGSRSMGDPAANPGFESPDGRLRNALPEPDMVYQAGRPEGLRHTRTGSYSSSLPLAAGAATPGGATPRMYPANYSNQSIPLDEYPSQPLPQVSYQDSPYFHSSRSYQEPIHQATIDPYNIADDGDDGFTDPPPKRRSILTKARQTSRDILPAAMVGGAATGNGVMRNISNMMGRSNNLEAQNTSYEPVDLANNAAQAVTPAKTGEKSEWLARQTKGNNKMRWTLFGVIGGIVLVAIIGGVIGGVFASKHKSSSSTSNSTTGNKNSGSSSPVPGSTNNAETDTKENGDLSKSSGEIIALMNNTNLHKVFPAIDYTPWGTQYPLCLEYPPSQNNVTRDMAMLSQLTNAVRLYGTDCNQTEMVLHAIDRLELTDMKIWMGVWVDFSNTTTNDRQLSQMYKIIEDQTDRSIFKGVIVGNEALYRAGVDKATSETQLITLLEDVKSNFTSKGWDLSIATSDLGDNWNAQLVNAVDMVMSNIHPFFAGVTATAAASWTWTFWQNHDAVLTDGTSKQQVISETGWPSAGGNDCGTTAACSTSTAGSVAGIDEMNTFMSDWVCQALSNGTEYFWFEAFDEPWKVVYNTPGKEWEDKWGLMDSARNLKTGLKIPDCNGKTV